MTSNDKTRDAPTASSSSAASAYGGLANITADMPDEQRLFYTLMTGYEKAVRPIKKSNEAVVVKLGITLTQIMDIVNYTRKKRKYLKLTSLWMVWFL